MPADAPVLPLLALDLMGVFVFALSGGLAAVRKDFDILGVLVLAGAAGLGGGVLRDVLIGDLPPVGVSDWRLLAAVGAAGLFTFFFHPGVRRIRRLVLVLDAVGLGVFTVAGTLKALDFGHGPLTAVIVGVLTGVGGGMIRDLLSGEVPQVLSHRELYATPALVGAVTYSALWSAGLDRAGPAWAAVVLIAALRLAAMRWRWQAPAPRPPAW